MVARQVLESLNLRVTPDAPSHPMSHTRPLLILLALVLAAFAAVRTWSPRGLEPRPELERTADGKPLALPVSELRSGRRASGGRQDAPRVELEGVKEGDSPRRDRRRALGELAERFDELPLPPEPGEYDGALVRELTDDGSPLFEVEQSQREDGVWVADGAWTSWHENGQVLEVGQYRMGVETGDWSWFDDNGQRVAVGTFVEGEREGVWTFWYSNGVKQMDARYEDGQGAGNWALYYEDGSPWAEGSYVDGEISGYWTIWDEFGELNPERTGFYEHGERVSD